MQNKEIPVSERLDQKTYEVFQPEIIAEEKC